MPAIVPMAAGGLKVISALLKISPQVVKGVLKNPAARKLLLDKAKRLTISGGKNVLLNPKTAKKIRTANFILDGLKFKEKHGTLRGYGDLKEVDGIRRYVDKNGKNAKGGEKHYLRSRPNKNKSNTDYQAGKRGAKPTINDYIEANTEKYPQSSASDIRKMSEQQYNLEQQNLKSVKINSTRDTHQDHIDPRSNGGMEHSNNYDVDVSSQYNGQKGDKVPENLDEIRNELLIGRTKKEQVLLEGPQPSLKLKKDLIRMIR